VLCGLVFFFFSSRRRHTRFSRDWSSDVCSSDLHLNQTRFDSARVWSLAARAWWHVPLQCVLPIPVKGEGRDQGSSGSRLHRLWYAYCVFRPSRRRTSGFLALLDRRLR